MRYMVKCTPVYDVTLFLHDHLSSSACPVITYTYSVASNNYLSIKTYHSNCHAAMPKDALVMSRMNVNPGGKQPVMKDRW